MPYRATGRARISPKDPYVFFYWILIGAHANGA